MPLPAQRVPTPIMAGSLDPSLIIPATPSFGIRGPAVGTVWNLTGMSIGILPSAVPGAPGPLGAVVRLLLSGDIIDEFEFPAAAVGRRQSLFHPYTPGFIVYDMSAIELNLGFDAANGTFTAHLNYRGQVEYT